jgi:hypothetical protein
VTASLWVPGPLPGMYEVEDSDGDPSVGDVVRVRSDGDPRASRWTEVLVNEIKFGNFFYMEMR